MVAAAAAVDSVEAAGDEVALGDYEEGVAGEGEGEGGLQAMRQLPIIVMITLRLRTITSRGVAAWRVESGSKTGAIVRVRRKRQHSHKHHNRHSSHRRRRRRRRQHQNHNNATESPDTGMCGEK